MKFKSGLITYSIIGSLAGFLLAFLPTQAIIPKLIPTEVRKIYSAKTPAIPVRLIIPELAVDAPIEPVGKDANGLMDIPKNIYNAGWYSLGVRPGKTGNAVIDGHFNTPDLSPNIFWRLNELRAGDLISVIDVDKQSWNFQVVETTEFSNADFPIDLVFGSTDKIRFKPNYMQRLLAI